jgi:DNA-binding winged helix-turn-helix (wHTH) protein/dienelactone hydrolase
MRGFVLSEGSRNGQVSHPSFRARFGPYELDLRSGELRKNNRKLNLRDQPFRILCALIEQPGKVVLRDEIRQKLWPDEVVVEFDHSINTAVKRLRDTLLDSAEKPRYIETLAKRGYRFIADVEFIPSVAPDSVAVPVNVAAASFNTTSATAGREPQTSTEPSRLFPKSGLLALATALVLLVLLAIWNYRRTAPMRWVKSIAIPEASRLVGAGQYPEAFPLVYRGLQILPQEPALNKLRRQIVYPIAIRTTPPGASVYVKPYRSPQTEWLYVGQSPLEPLPLPAGLFRWKVTKPGFQQVERAEGLFGPSIDFVLDKAGSVPTDMVHVPAADFQLFNYLESVRVDDFWMDKYEVSNRQFKEFVDKGGYVNRDYWREPFILDGRTLSWEEAMAKFVDSTGRAGPASWEVSHYPAGQNDFPVTGVSWYEAAAYSAFAEKQLPTVHQWYRAASQNIYSDILKFSNFSSKGTVQVGSLNGLGPFGTYDMAGNAEEWCLNATAGRRYILGGAWNEESYSYTGADVERPFDRSVGNGFRCVRNPKGPLPEVMTHPIDRRARDHRTEKPVSDAMFHILESFYSYDHSSLDAVVESRRDDSPLWRAEKITMNAAYEHQRFAAWLYLPKSGKAPFQTIVVCPSGAAELVPDIDDVTIHSFEFLLKSGRAVLLPVYQGMYTRRATRPLGPNGSRDEIVQQAKDFRRSLDYLATRTDIALDKLGFFGTSAGARRGIIFVSQEPRIRAVVWGEVGFSSQYLPPEIDEINFAPHVKPPVLLLEGRDDFFHPELTNQIPMFQLLGTAPAEKKRLLLNTGHAGPVELYVKDTLDWFDKYLGKTSNQ